MRSKVVSAQEMRQPLQAESKVCINVHTRYKLPKKQIIFKRPSMGGLKALNVEENELYVNVSKTNPLTKQNSDI